MTDPLVIALMSAIAAMASAIVALYRANARLHETANRDKDKAANLIFALLQARRDDRGEPSPPTLSEWGEEPTTQVTDRKFAEASAHAQTELNGDVAALLKRYLSNTPSEPAKPPWPRP